jgi:tRNA G18 (ribose-2'-O)-methylase SpoU
MSEPETDFSDVPFKMRKLTHAEISEKRVTVEHAETMPRLPIVVLVDNVRSLYNVGSIFRTSDGVMIEKLILCGYTPHPPRKEIEKTALGATKSVPWEYVKHPIEAIQELKNKRFTISCLELTNTSVPYFEVEQSSFPLCLIIGNEITGVSKELIDACELGIEIPMVGTKQSLNVAVAYGIAVFELARICKNTPKSKG